MRVVLDTNVFISSVFFGGVPGKILDMWRDGRLDILLSLEVLAEYEDVARKLQARYPGVNPDPIMSLVIQHGSFVQAAALPEPVCVDPDDDRFLAAALAGSARIVISGDKHLLDVSGYRQINVLSPAEFLQRYGLE